MLDVNTIVNANYDEPPSGRSGVYIRVLRPLSKDSTCKDVQKDRVTALLLRSGIDTNLMGRSLSSVRSHRAVSCHTDGDGGCTANRLLVLAGVHERSHAGSTQRPQLHGPRVSLSPLRSRRELPIHPAPLRDASLLRLPVPASGVSPLRHATADHWTRIWCASLRNT